MKIKIAAGFILTLFLSAACYLLLDEELEKRDAPVQDDLKRNNVHPCLVIGDHQIPFLPIQAFDTTNVQPI